MLLVPLQVAAALTLPVDLGARPGDVASLGGGRSTLTGAASEDTDLVVTGGVELGIGLGLGLEVTGRVSAATQLFADDDDTSMTPPLPTCTTRSPRALHVGAVGADPAEAARRATRVGLRWKIPTQSLAIRSDLFPSAAGGELRLEAWRRLGARLAVTGFGGWRLLDSDEAVTWGAGAQLRVAGALHAIAGAEGATGAEDGERARLVAGVRLDLGPVDLLAMGGSDVISDDGWLVGVGVTVRMSASSPPVVPQIERPRPEPVRLLVILPDEEAFGDPEADDDRVGADLVEDRAVAVTRVADELVLGESIYFARDRSRVRRAFHAPLRALAAYLGEHPEIRRIRIHGHTDPSGPEEWNESLAEARARAVADQLIARGVSPDRIELAGFGARVPSAPNDSEEGRARNRRVVFEVVR